MSTAFNHHSFLSCSPKFETVEQLALFAQQVYPLAFKLRTSGTYHSYSYGIPITNSIELNLRFCEDIVCNVYLSDNKGDNVIADIKKIIDLKHVSPLELLRVSLKTLPRNNKSKHYIRCYIEAFSSGYTSENYFKLCEAYSLTSWTFYHMCQPINNVQYVLSIQHNQNNIGQFITRAFCRTEKSIENISEDWIQVNKNYIIDDMSLISLIQEHNSTKEHSENIAMLKRKISIDYFTQS